MAVNTIVFDLDGTLIDSSTSILAGFAAAFAELGRQPVIALEPGIIGPPLKETLAQLAGTTDPAVIETLSSRFKAYYDSEGYKATTVFAGVPEMLASLAKRFPLYIATNKRISPTLKIVEYLGWNPWFARLYALDSWAPPANRKSEMIDRAVTELALDRASTLYVGDRREDGEAATENQLLFALAEWGYGKPEHNLPAHWQRLSHPSQLSAD